MDKVYRGADAQAVRYVHGGKARTNGRTNYIALASITKLLLFLVAVAVTAGLYRYLYGDLSAGYLNRGHFPSPALQEADFDWYALEPARTIQWTSCYSNQRCARLLLPLDYDIPDGPTTAIALRMIPAANRENHLGTLLVNPGGPGGSGTDFIARRGEQVSRIVGDSFDVLGFDPRGIGASTPSARCFETDSQRKLWNLQEDGRLLNLTDGSVEMYRARERLVAARCEEKIGGEDGIARFSGTPSVARDMLEITRQLGQEKLQYWGFSYGTVLGQYFAAMYPDKVGRLIIDGVFDAYSYRANIWDTSLVDTDAVIGSFFDFCHQAGPDKCPLWNSSASKIRERYFNVLRSVEEEPIAIPLAEPPLLLTRKHLHQQIFQAAYKPLAGFPPVADTIYAIESRNQTALTALAPKILDPTECNCAAANQPWRAGSEAFRAVECGDGDEQPYNPTEYEAFYEGLLGLSPLAAPVWAPSYLACAEWRVRPKWRWTGPFAAKNTSHPLLMVSPRYDPVCPLADAQAVHARFGGAGLLVQNSYGHCSIAAPSLCTAKYIRAYMVNGTLPPPGTVCEVDELPFVGAVQNARAMSAEDAELLEALRALAMDLPLRAGPR
ncbi:alpha/beta-hydrolase [Pilatotrama ljubarskyi]|nr:alpha/beta-hydrolase [Pilatotrama ljubarskyi]